MTIYMLSGSAMAQTKNSSNEITGTWMVQDGSAKVKIEKINNKSKQFNEEKNKEIVDKEDGNDKEDIDIIIYFDDSDIVTSIGFGINFIGSTVKGLKIGDSIENAGALCIAFSSDWRVLCIPS